MDGLQEENSLQNLHLLLSHTAVAISRYPQKTLLAHDAINKTVTNISPASVYATCHGAMLR